MNDVPLKEVIEMLLNERDLRYQERFAAQEKALQVALDVKVAHDAGRRANLAIIIALVSILLVALGMWVR